MKIPVRYIQDEQGNKLEVAIPYSLYESTVRPLLEGTPDEEPSRDLKPVDLDFFRRARTDLSHLKNLDLSSAVLEDREDRF